MDNLVLSAMMLLIYQLL